MNNQHREHRTCKTIQEFNRQCAQQRAKQTSSDQHPKYQKRVHNYVIDTRNILGEGTFSAVYRGKNIEKDKEVAVKVTELKTIEKMGIKELLWQQLNIIQQLRHPNIVTCYQYFRTPNNCYTIYEYCQGGDLASILARGPLGQKEYINQANLYIKDIFQGLLYLETMNIIHRDIKAANILISKGKAKIGDFGFATRCKSQFRDASIGSPAYMSPEGLLHNVYGPKTDVWAFGMLVYELLHGMSPFNFCQSENELKKAIKVPVNWDQLKATLPSSLKRLILKCLKVSVEERPKFSDLLTDEYIQKLYQHGAHSKADQKSNYSKNTSDSEKIYESVSLTLFNTNKQKKEDQILSSEDGSKRQLVRAHSLQREIEAEFQIKTEQESQIIVESKLQQNGGYQLFESNLMDKVSLNKFYFVPEVLTEEDKQNWRKVYELFVETVKYLSFIDCNQIDFSIIKKITTQFIKEIYSRQVLNRQEQPLHKEQTDKLNILLQASDVFAEQLLSIASDSFFQLIKHLQKLIDKQDMHSTHSKQSQLSKTLVLCGNHLILCYKAWPYLSKSQYFPQLLQYKSKQLTSSEQFYIWLYEIQLQQMELSSK